MFTVVTIPFIDPRYSNSCPHFTFSYALFPSPLAKVNKHKILTSIKNYYTLVTTKIRVNVLAI
jgi:hypothetical protein